MFTTRMESDQSREQKTRSLNPQDYDVEDTKYSKMKESFDSAELLSAPP